MENSRKWNRAVCVGMALVTLGIAGCAKDHPGQSSTEAKNDMRITSDVKKALKGSATYKYPNVTVDTYDGSVSLSGFVNTEPQKREAANIARNVMGVRQVIDGTVIKPLPTGRPPLVETNIKVPPVTPAATNAPMEQTPSEQK